MGEDAAWPNCELLCMFRAKICHALSPCLALYTRQQQAPLRMPKSIAFRYHPDLRVFVLLLNERAQYHRNFITHAAANHASPY
jgi:hypothetical protein